MALIHFTNSSSLFSVDREKLCLLGCVTENEMFLNSIVTSAKSYSVQHTCTLHLLSNVRYMYSLVPVKLLVLYLYVCGLYLLEYRRRST